MAVLDPSYVALEMTDLERGKRQSQGSVKAGLEAKDDIENDLDEVFWMKVRKDYFIM
jgi:hypothetical protein